MNNVALPLVSVITVNYNQAAVTHALLKSLEKISYTSVEIIVVDNGSIGDDIKNVVQDFPSVRLILTNKNLGFAGGNNVGIKAAKGELILLINNDVEVTPGFLEPLLETIQSKPSIGFVSPKILFFDSGEIIQYAGSHRISPYTGRGKRIGYLEKDTGQYDKVYKTEFGHGACLLVSRDVIKKVGLMPEIYFLYYEESDWVEQARKKGFEVYFTGTSMVYHKESISTGKNSPLKTYYMARNRIIYLNRNTSGIKRSTALLFYIFIATPKKLIFFLLKGEVVNFKSYLSGLAWHLQRK